jgi:alpha-L-fucosidase
MKKLFLFVMLCVTTVLNIQAKPAEKSTNKMDWWQEAKFGLFVHWGPYCLYGGVYHDYKQARGGAEWIMNRCKIPVGEYRAMASTFNPVKFNAEQLVLMAKNAGMKYVVLTSKHHDGFAMFKSNASNFNIVDYTPFKRDVVDEVANACRKHGMKFGLYYSHAQDWNNAGGATSRKEMREGWPNPDSTYINNFTKAHRGAWDYRQLERSFADYIHQVSIPQIKELLGRYKDLAILWFDTPTNMNDELAQEIHDLMQQYPQIITNDRLKRPNFPGDYKTPEGKVPKPEDVKGVYWETCMNIGSSWGFKSWDKNWKSTDDIIRTLLMCAARGGNLLLNVGPDPMGLVPQPAQECLQGVGQWLQKYGEVVYGTQRSELYPTWGECVRKDLKKNSVLYLCVYDWPADGKLHLDGNYKVKQASLLQNGAKVKYRKGKNQLILDLPAQPLEKVTIVKVELRNKLPEIRPQSNSQKYFDIVDDK